VVKVRTYGALMGALLTIAGVESAEAAECNCIPTPPKHAAVHPAPRPAPHMVHRADEGRAYAQSWYDYHSASRVTESFVRHAPVVVAPAIVRPIAPPPVVRDDGFRVAPNDARIRFYRDERVIYVPTVAYPPPPPPAAYYPPPPPPPAYYGPAPTYGSYDQSYFSGGVGYGEAGGGAGGGYGGVVTLANGGDQDAPPNGGGENIPPGYGPNYLGQWQGPTVPTRGGLAGH
jgi:hypothetical protein